MEGGGGYSWPAATGSAEVHSREGPFDRGAVAKARPLAFSAQGFVAQTATVSGSAYGFVVAPHSATFATSSGLGPTGAYHALDGALSFGPTARQANSAQLHTDVDADLMGRAEADVGAAAGQAALARLGASAADALLRRGSAHPSPADRSHHAHAGDGFGGVGRPLTPDLPRFMVGSAWRWACMSLGIHPGGLWTPQPTSAAAAAASASGDVGTGRAASSRSGFADGPLAPSDDPSLCALLATCNLRAIAGSHLLTFTRVRQLLVHVAAIGVPAGGGGSGGGGGVEGEEADAVPAVLEDPTGRMAAMLSCRAMEEHAPGLRQGAVLLLRGASVFCTGIGAATGGVGSGIVGVSYGGLHGSLAAAGAVSGGGGSGGRGRGAATAALGQGVCKHLLIQPATVVAVWAPDTPAPERRVRYNPWLGDKLVGAGAGGGGEAMGAGAPAVRQGRPSMVVY